MAESSMGRTRGGFGGVNGQEGERCVAWMAGHSRFEDDMASKVAGLVGWSPVWDGLELDLVCNWGDGEVEGQAASKPV